MIAACGRLGGGRCEGDSSTHRRSWWNLEPAERNPKIKSFATCRLRTCAVACVRLSTPASESGLEFNQRLIVLSQTTMSRPLPPELLDLIIDHLRDQPTALRVCCLVSKSWVPWSRMHLFARVEFTRTSIESWVKAFPDPQSSPARYTRTLAIRGPWLFTVECPAVGRQIRAFPFHNVVHLTIGCKYGSGRVSLVPFHGLSPTIRSLRLELNQVQPAEVFGLVCSFPLLEDLGLFGFNYLGRVDGWPLPSTSPSLTGSLQLNAADGGISNIICRLWDLPNGPKFTKIQLSSIDDETDVTSASYLVSSCSDTLESLEVSDYSPCGFPSVPALDLNLIAARSPPGSPFV